MPPPPHHPTATMKPASSVVAMALTQCIDIDQGRGLDTWSGPKDDMKVSSPVCF